MGYRACWLAVKNAKPDAVLRTVGLRQESESNEPIYDPGHYAVAMPGGWLVVLGDGRDAMDSIEPEHARVLSAGTEALHFSCDDTSMCASLIAYSDKKELWSIEHDGSGGAAAPAVAGTPPALVAEVIARCQRAQVEAGDQNVDHLYEAAPEIGLALTGFRHDQTLGDGEHLPILVLAPK